jgi:cysteine dioxygenase
MQITSTLSLAAVRDALLALPRPFTCDAVQAVVKRLAPTREELAPYLNFSPDGYTRTLFYGGPDFEILVLCWQEGQVSPIHDHAASICSMAVVHGTCSSETYRLASPGAGHRPPEGTSVPLEMTREDACQSGNVVTVTGGDIHRVGNRPHSGEDLVTIHFYLPPILSMRCFHEETGLCRIVEPITLAPRV